MSNKPRSSQISVNTTGFNKNLSISDDNVQKALNTIDQLGIDSSTLLGGGDLDGYLNNITVVGINGIPISNLPLSDGYSYVYSIGNNEWVPSYTVTQYSVTPGKDLTGTISDAYVIGFNGVGINRTANLSDGYAYLYNASTNKWVPGAVSTSIPTLGGDISGTLGSVTVDKIKGVAISTTSPTDGYALIYDQGQTKWVPKAVSTTPPSNYALSGDLSGNTSDAYVVGFNGVDINASAALSDGYAYLYNASTNKWVPGAVSTSIPTLGGDITGTLGSMTIDKIKGITVNTTTPQDGYAYIYSQSANQWVPSKVNNSTVITAGKQDILTANATSYILPNFTESTDETAIAFLAPVAGTLSNLVCYCSTAPGGSESVAITVRKNGVDTAITGTISGSATTASDLSNTVNLASGDRVTIKSVVTAGSSAANLFVSLIFTVPTMNSAIVSGGSGGATYGIYSNMPSSTSSGSVYYATDSPTSTWVYGNSAWNPIVKDVICKKPPLASAFTKINDGGAGHSLTDAYGSLIFSVPNDGANTYNRGYCISYSNASAYVECVVPLNLYAPASDYYFTGLIMRESSTAKSYSIGFRKENTNVMSLQIFKRANDNDAATYTMAAINNSNDYMFLRIRLSGSNIISEYSSDKYIWAQFNSSTIASIFTTAPNQIGLSGWGYNRTASHVIQHFDYGSL